MRVLDVLDLSAGWPPFNRRPHPPEESWYSILSEGRSPLEPLTCCKNKVNQKIELPQREWNLGHFGLYNSASINYAIVCSL
jgi:hypothetical protein